MLSAEDSDFPMFDTVTVPSQTFATTATPPPNTATTTHEVTSVAPAEDKSTGVPAVLGSSHVAPEASGEESNEVVFGPEDAAAVDLNRRLRWEMEQRPSTPVEWLDSDEDNNQEVADGDSRVEKVIQPTRASQLLY